MTQVRSQKSAMGRLLWGSGSVSPGARKFCVFWQKLLNFRTILIKKIMLLKRGIEIGSADMVKLVALIGRVVGD